MNNNPFIITETNDFLINDILYVYKTILSYLISNFVNYIQWINKYSKLKGEKQ